ncbi:hypothetical protein Misp02_11580 [Microtetraspora sp. NBRC 16547]|nr:hypothetical protein Misp02_11580 [Microtetraspora sp. NBRC 16547]
MELLSQKLDCSLTYLINGVTAEQMEELELGLRFARLALDNGEVEEARRRFGELLDDKSMVGLSQLRQDAEFGYALAAEACGHLGEAIAILNRLLDAEAGAMPEDRRVAIAVALCRCYREKGDLGPAVQVGETMLKDMNRATWTDDLIELAATLLAAYGVRGDLLRATQFANELLAAADLLGTPRATVAANWNAARIAELTGRGDESLALAERALAVQSENGDSRNLARLRLAYAILLLRVRPDDLETARDLLARTHRELGESAASKADIARCSVFLARTELALHRPEEAAEHARAAKDLTEGSLGELRAEAHLVLGQAYEQLGRREEAAVELAAAGEWLERSPKIRMAAQGWLEAAEAFQRIEDHAAGALAYRRALACVGL